MDIEEELREAFVRMDMPVNLAEAAVKARPVVKKVTGGVSSGKLTWGDLHINLDAPPQGSGGSQVVSLHETTSQKGVPGWGKR